MSSNRLTYDDSAYAAQVKQSIEPLNHSLSDFYGLNCDTCIPEPSVATPNKPKRYNNEMIEVENLLSNRNWKRDKKQFNCNYRDVFQPTASKLCNSLALRECVNGELLTTNTLLNNPKVNSKGQSIQHLVFYGVPINQQSVAPLLRNPGFMSSRDIAISEYKKNLKTQK